MAVFLLPSFLFRCPLSLKIMVNHYTDRSLGTKKGCMYDEKKKMHDNLLYTHFTSVPKS